MENLPNTPVMKFPPDTLKNVRKCWDLDGPGRMKQAIDILDEWIKKQQHFVKKDFPREYLETTIICSKGSIERAKKRIDKLCTSKTFAKHLFGMHDMKKDFTHILGEKLYLGILPTLTKDYCRVAVFKFHKMIEVKDFNDMCRAIIIGFEYCRKFDYVNGNIVLADVKDLNILEFASKINPVEVRQFMTTFIEGYGMRLKGLYILSTSNFIQALISVLKQVFSTKIGGRIHAIKSVEAIYEHIPKDILPKDYGGNEKSLVEIHDDWMEELSSDKFTKYRREMNEACTDETLRPVDTFNDQYMGMPGTFKALNLD